MSLKHVRVRWMLDEGMLRPTGDVKAQVSIYISPDNYHGPYDERRRPHGTRSFYPSRLYLTGLFYRRLGRRDVYATSSAHVCWN